MAVFLQGKVTTTAIAIQRSPGLLTDCLRLAKVLSRECPRLLIFAPERRSRVRIDDEFDRPTSVDKGVYDEREQLLAHN